MKKYLFHFLVLTTLFCNGQVLLEPAISKIIASDSDSKKESRFYFIEKNHFSIVYQQSTANHLYFPIIEKFDHNGNLLWKKSYTELMSTLGLNSVYGFVSFFKNSNYFFITDSLLVKLDANGEFLIKEYSSKIHVNKFIALSDEVLSIENSTICSYDYNFNLLFEKQVNQENIGSIIDFFEDDNSIYLLGSSRADSIWRRPTPLGSSTVTFYIVELNKSDKLFKNILFLDLPKLYRAVNFIKDSNKNKFYFSGIYQKPLTHYPSDDVFISNTNQDSSEVRTFDTGNHEVNFSVDFFNNEYVLYTNFRAIPDYSTNLFSTFFILEDIVSESTSLYQTKTSDYWPEQAFNITGDSICIISSLKKYNPYYIEYRLDKYHISTITSLPLSNDSKFSIHPNPTSSFVHIEGLTLVDGECVINLLNSQGQTVKSQTVGTSTENIDLTELPSGLYNLKLSQKNTYQHIGKIMKK